MIVCFLTSSEAAAVRWTVGSSSSFKRGLEPTEFFMLSVSGRESLMTPLCEPQSRGTCSDV